MNRRVLSWFKLDLDQSPIWLRGLSEGRTGARVMLQKMILRMVRAHISGLYNAAGSGLEHGRDAEL